MNKNMQLLCAHSALMPLIFIGAGWFFLPQWFPPLDPALDPDALMAMYAEDRTRIRIGMSLAALCGAFWWTFSAAIAGQMRRMEGLADPILSRVQMGAASGTALVIIFCAYFILAVSYRPDMSVSNIQLLHDLAWLMFIGCYPPGFVQNASIGLCILSNKSGVDVYPRWLGYANLWFALLTVPGVLLPFFHGGPFAWNGIIGFWVVAIFFFLWIILNYWLTVKAIKNQPDENLATQQ